MKGVFAMYDLHFAPDNASLILRLVMAEAAIPYRAVLVDRATRQQDGADYRRLNPTGLIPTLVTPQGAVSETAACLLWLAETHPRAGLAPAVGDESRGAFLNWLLFLSNTAHADLRQLFYPDQYVPEAARAGHCALMQARMKRHFALLDKAASARPALFTAACVLAPYTAVLMRWCVLYPKGAESWFQITDYPALQAMAAALETRPATRAAAAAEGLGPCPFTAPQYACPPIGSAT